MSKTIKGIFVLSFLNLEAEPTLKWQDFERLRQLILPIVKDIDCDIIITNKPLMAIDRENFKDYLEGLLEEVKKLEKDKGERYG